MKTSAIAFLFLLCWETAALAIDNPVFRELREQGVPMSDGSKMTLPEPYLTDGLDAAGQQAALKKLCDDSHSSWKEVGRKAWNSPIVMKVRTVRTGEGESPSVRAIDLCFIVYGDWEVLNSKSFLESLAKHDQENKNTLVSKSGVLTPEELSSRKSLQIELPSSQDEANRTDLDSRIVYTTFSLFDRVEISATRLAAVTREQGSVLAAAKIDPRFNEDAEFPNAWRLLLRDAMANIQPGPAHPYVNAGGYAKITRLIEPENAVAFECHLIFEEPYAWFDGVNLVKQKTPPMVQEQVRTLRRKLAVASEK